MNGLQVASEGTAESLYIHKIGDSLCIKNLLVASLKPSLPIVRIRIPRNACTWEPTHAFSSISSYSGLLPSSTAASLSLPEFPTQLTSTFSSLTDLRCASTVIMMITMKVGLHPASTCFSHQAVSKHWSLGTELLYSVAEAKPGCTCLTVCSFAFSVGELTTTRLQCRWGCAT